MIEGVDGFLDFRPQSAMTPTELNPLAALPYELIREICLNLDKSSLKSLRLAYPQPKLRAATAKLLFQTIELRLGTLEWSLAGAKSRLSHLDGFSSGKESFDNPLALCKKLLIDTRYPWVVTPEGCIKANQVPHDRVPHDAWLEQRRMFDDLMVLIPEKQRTEFVDLVRGVLAATRNLRTVEWRTTSSLPIQVHQGISSLLCKPIDTRGFLLDVAISVSTFSDKCEYLDALSNVQYVAIKVVGSGPHRGDHHGLEEMREAGEVVKRCPDIKGFEFYSQAPVFAYATSDALRDALRDLDGLEVFKVDSNLGFTHEMDWTSLKDVKDLWVSVEGSVTHNEDLEELYDGLKTVGTRLNKLSVESYIRPTHDYLLQHCSPLTELEIWGYWYGINQDLVHAFWDEIIPRHAPTLRKLKVQNHAQSENKSWSWLNKSDNRAKASLPKCKELEELTIGFCEGTLTSTSWVTEMVEDLVPACPRLSDIHMTFELGDSNLLAQHVKSTLASLDAWSSTSKIFNGRSLRLSHEDISKGVVCFPKQSKPDTIPPLWYESLLQSWELSRAISQADDGTADQTVDEVDDEDDDLEFAVDDAEAKDGEAWYLDGPDLY
ncbi:hypothetical protein TWF191_002147 [Orbilia oligospora]|uniref:F-box domain-containing protein n=2 Tax=Orbilia oligospora TaxID=2813651 RepID=A0A7C8QXU3_ORBOL|nr:hypothetical protein TWF191_002147 [Orbilia oligospora]